MQSPNQGEQLNTAVKPLFQASFAIYYEGKDITDKMAEHILSIEYSDSVLSNSDAITLVLESINSQWLTTWYPKKGKRISLKINSHKQGHLACHDFVIDEILFSRPLSTLTIKANASNIPSLHHCISRVYEQTSLSNIVKSIAQRHRLQLIGNIADLNVDWITQYQESDVNFLNRLAYEYSHLFKITGKKIIFTNIKRLSCAGDTLALSMSDVQYISLKENPDPSYKEIKLTYHNPENKELVVARTSIYKSKNSAIKANAQVRHISLRAPSLTIAQARVNAIAEEAQWQRMTGHLKILGQPKMVAGHCLHLPECGIFSGKYLMMSSRHCISRTTGYITELEISKIDL